jgi:hypothetical protein
MNSGSRTGRPRPALGIAVIVVAAATAAMGVTVIASIVASDKNTVDPWAGLTDQQKQAVVDQAHQRNVQYLNNFEARHGDPRSLPVIKIATYQPGAMTVGVAVAQADVIVRGHVDAVRFTAAANGGMPQMTATLRVEMVGKGSVNSSIVVRQQGGPVAQAGNAGALVQFEDEQLILPGDDVLLLLSHSQAKVGEYRPVYGPGVMFVLSERLSGDAAKRYGLGRRSFAETWATLTDPNLSSQAFPLQATSN